MSKVEKMLAAMVAAMRSNSKFILFMLCFSVGGVAQVAVETEVANVLLRYAAHLGVVYLTMTAMIACVAESNWWRHAMAWLPGCFSERVRDWIWRKS